MDNDQQIEGLPPGAIVKPLGGSVASQPAQVEGLPAGAIVKPIGAASASSAAAPDAGDGTDTGDPNSNSFAQNFANVNLPFDEGYQKPFAEAARTVGHLVHKIPGVAGLVDGSTMWQKAREAVNQAADVKPEGVAGKAGNAVADVQSWILPEAKMKDLAEGAAALVKGGSYAEKLKAIQPLLDTAAKHPVLGRVIYSALSQAGLGGALTAIRGGSAEDVAKTAAASGVAGGAADLATGAAKGLADLVKPGEAQIAGETVPVLASQKVGASPLAAKVADIGSEPQIAEAQQRGSVKAIRNMAQNAAHKALTAINESRQARWESGEADMNLAGEGEAAGATVPQSRRLGDGQAALESGNTAPQLENGVQNGIAKTNEVGAYEGEAASEGGAGKASPEDGGSGGDDAGKGGGKRVSYIEEKPSNFKPVDADKESSDIVSYGQAADKIREHAKPVYERLDTVTNGKFGELRNQLSDAYNDQDYAKVRDTEKSIDDLLDSTRGKVDKADYQSAKNAWRTSKVLDAANSAVFRAFNIGDESLAKDAGVWRGISGGKLQTGVNRLVERYGRSQLDNVLGKDALPNLVKIADLTQTPKNAAAFGQAVNEIAGHAMSMKKGGLVGATLGEARNMVLHSAATNPRVASYLDYAVKNGVSPRIFAPLVTATMEETRQHGGEEQ